MLQERLVRACSVVALYFIPFFKVALTIRSNPKRVRDANISANNWQLSFAIGGASEGATVSVLGVTSHNSIRVIWASNCILYLAS